MSTVYCRIADLPVSKLGGVLRRYFLVVEGNLEWGGSVAFRCNIGSPGDDEISLLERFLRDEELQASTRVVAQ